MAAPAGTSHVRTLFVTLFAVGATVWFGMALARMVIGFDLFVPGTTELKAVQAEAVRLHTIWLYTLLGGWVGWSYAVAVLGAIGTALTTARLWKDHGWMLMCTLLFAVTIPGQVWSIMQDIDLWRMFDPATGMPLASADDVMRLFLQRTTDVVSSVISGSNLLIAVTIVILVVWRPLRRPEPPTEPTETA